MVDLFDYPVSIWQTSTTLLLWSKIGSVDSSFSYRELEGFENACEAPLIVLTLP